MPTDPNNPYVDVPHPKTVAGEGWTYGCHSDKVGEVPRGRTTSGFASAWGPFPEMVTTHWLDKKCGHQGRSKDNACIGCVNRE